MSSNIWPVGTVVIGTEADGIRKFVAMKLSQGTHSTANPSMWTSSYGYVPEQTILAYDLVEYHSVDRYDEGFEDGYFDRASEHWCGEHG